MSHLEQLEDKIQHTFTSGQPGTTGREPFEEDRGEGNPYHRQHEHGQHHIPGASSSGHHEIGTGSDLIGRSSTGTGNERDINSGSGGLTGQHGTGAGVGSGLTGDHNRHTGTGAGATGAVGAGIAGAEREAHKHSSHSGTHTGTSTGLSGSSLTGTGHDNQHTGLTGTSGAGTHENRGVDYPTTGSGISSGGTAGGAGITVGTKALGEQGSGVTGSHHHGTGSGLTTHEHGTGLTGTHSGSTGATGALENAARRETDKHTSYGGVHDRTGNLGQDSALYERTGPGGPVTGGAAGTDRFDTDRTHGTHGSGLTGSSGHHDATGEHGRENLSRTSGAGGILGTSDKDFIGRDRKAEGGAYADETGRYQGNTTGPSGSALTGREGTNPERDNPVARAGQDVRESAESSHPGVAHGRTNELEGKDGQEGQKGIFQKIKELI